MDATVAVPPLILASWKGVHIQDGVDALSCTSFNHSINEFESFRLQRERLQVVHEVPVIDWYTNAVEPERPKELGIFACEEVFEELYEPCQTGLTF
jgi:hypothetical protein